MNLKKTLQSLLLTSTLLSAVCAHGMDDDTAMDSSRPVSAFNAAQNLTDPGEKSAHFKQAAVYFEKALEKRGDTATAQGYMDYGASYFNATLILTDSEEKAAMLARSEELDAIIKQKFSEY